MSMDVVHVADGTGSNVLAICVDITERSATEKALLATAKRYEFLDRLSEATRGLTSATEIMGVTARMLGEHLAATRCAYADVERDNDRFTIRNDWSRAGMSSSVGVYSLDLFGPLAAHNLRRGQRLVVRDVDAELSDDGGRMMFNAIHIKAIVTAPLVKDGRLVAMMAVHQATPRDWTDDEIALIAEVVDRCWAHIERVRDADMLREQDRHKDEFLATLAHELRNPLAPMRYATALMKMTDDPVVTTRARDIVERQVAQMTRLIDDLLDISRVNRGLIELQKQRVRLDELLEQAIESARPAVDAANHRLHVQVADEPLWLEADPARVLQMVGNLLNNAVKYTADGGEIRLHARAEGGLAIVEIADTGLGIPLEDQGRLFSMFTQLPHTVHRAKGGLGIGLSLVRTLAAMHGGEALVHSAGLDQGSTFTIRLPLAPAATQVDDTAAVTVGDWSTTSSGRRVLVVEDNDDGRMSLVELLMAAGYDVAAAATGPDAVAEASRFQPDVVLLDLGLPGFDGYEVARRLRADPSLASVKLLALTGWGAPGDLERTKQAGFQAHLTKPIEPQALQECLALWA